jgi:hypothetical protein
VRAGQQVEFSRGRRPQRAGAAQKRPASFLYKVHSRAAYRRSSGVRNTESPVSMLRNIDPGVRNIVVARSATGGLGVGRASSYSSSAPQRRQAGGGAGNR